MKKAVVLIIILTSFKNVKSQDLTRMFHLNDLIIYAKNNSLSFKIAKSNRDLAVGNYQIYKTDLRPRLNMIGNLIDYNKTYLSVTQPDGTISFRQVAQNYSNIQLSLSQKVHQTGGTISITNSLTRYDNWDVIRESQYTGSPISISISQPLFSFNDFKTRKEIENLKIQEAERGFTSENERIALQTTRLFFELLGAQAELDLVKSNLANQRRIFDIETKRIVLGTTTKATVLQIELQLLNSSRDLNIADSNLKKALFQLNNYIGFSDTAKYSVILPTMLPAISISEEVALKRAEENREEYARFIRQKLEAKRKLIEIKKDRFDVQLFAQYGYNGTSTTLPSIYKNPNQQASILIGLEIPIVDFGRNKAKLRAANAEKDLVDHLANFNEINLRQEISFMLENLSVNFKNISIYEKADKIAIERYNLTSEQFKFGKTNVTELNIALTEKDNAKRLYINALKNFWEAYYQIRVLTLMDI
jgi:outer membrane protein TolC